MADLESAAPETFGVSVEQVSALAPLVTLEAAADTDPVYSDDGRVDISRADVEGWIQAVAARVDLRLAGRSRITDEPRTKTLRAAAHDAVVNGAASYLVAAATPTRASLNDAGSYDAVLWARYESALDGAGLALDGWLETADPAATEIRARMSGNFPLPAFPDGFRF